MLTPSDIPEGHAGRDFGNLKWKQHNRLTCCIPCVIIKIKKQPNLIRLHYEARVRFVYRIFYKECFIHDTVMSTSHILSFMLQ